VRGVDRVVIRDGDAISADADPARGARLRAGLGRSGGSPRGAGHRRTGWRTSTTRTCAAPRGGGGGRRAGGAALEILGPERPSTWSWRAACGVANRTASLEELGTRQPPLTKDAIAGGSPPARDGRPPPLDQGLPPTEAFLTWTCCRYPWARSPIPGRRFSRARRLPLTVAFSANIARTDQSVRDAAQELRRLKAATRRSRFMDAIFISALPGYHVLLSRCSREGHSY